MLDYSDSNTDMGRLTFKQGHSDRYLTSQTPAKGTGKYRCYRCPHCGEQVESVRGRGPGAPKKSFHEANGETKHVNDWAAQLGVTVPALSYYLKKKWPMQKVYDRLTDPAYRKPGPAQGHNWKKAVKPEERKNDQ